MWWPERLTTMIRGTGLALTLLAASVLGGCFEPLYGERTLSGGPGLRQRLSSVDVAPISAPNGSPLARIAVALRNAVIFDLSGGAGSQSPTHRLDIQVTSNTQQVIVDITTARPDVEQYGINARYTLTELATGKPVVTGQTFARVTYDNPGQAQRFARSRGQLDAEDRAIKVISDSIKSRLASYFSAGT